MKTFMILVFFQIICLGFSGNPVTESSIRNRECSDPNAELRDDNPDCIVTCDKRSVSNNSEFCFGRIQLTSSCYCKNTFVLDETTKTCVQPNECPCNSTNNEIARYSNVCANGCGTYHTLVNCPGVTHGGCWCKPTYCTNGNGACVEKE